MATPPSNSVSTHTLRLRSDATSMKRGLDAVDKQLSQVVVQLDRQQAASAKLSSTQNRNVQANKRLAASTQQVANEYKRAAASAEIFQSEIHRLSLKYKPLYAASKQYENQLNELNQTHRLGILTTQQHAEAVEQLNMEYQAFQNGTAGWSNQFVTGAKRGRRAVNRMGMHMQHVGYQVSDFVVQVQGGTSAFVAFGQQGAQLFQLIPGWGPILSIAAAAVGAFGAAWMRSKEDMEEAETAAEALEDRIKSLDETLAAWDRTKKAAGLGMSEDELTGTEAIARAQDDLVAAQSNLQNLLSRSAPAPGLGMFIIGDPNELDRAVAREIKKARDAVLTAQERLAQVQAKQREEELVSVKKHLGDIHTERGNAERAAAKEYTDRVKQTAHTMAVIESERLAAVDAQRMKDAEAIDARMRGQDQAHRQQQKQADEAARDLAGRRAAFSQFDAETMAIAGRFTDEAEVMSQYWDEAQTNAAALLPTYNEIVARAELMRQAGEDTRNAMFAVAAGAEAGVTVLGRMANEAARGATSMWSWMQAMSAVFARQGGGRGSVVPNQADISVMGSGGIRMPSYPDKKGGGGKSQAEKDREKAIKDAEKMAKALAEATEAANQFGKAMEDNLASLASSTIDNFVDSLIAGEFAFKDFARSIMADLAKIMLRAAIVQALMSAFGGSPGQAATGLQRIVQQIAGITQITANAKGNAFDGGNVIPFARGGVINGPTAFPMTNGLGLMGEAGPEAVMPLSRGSDGKLGVAGPAITINNYTGQDVTVDRTEEVITIAVGRSRQAIQNDFSRSLASGQGTYARAIESGTNARRKVS